MLIAASVISILIVGMIILFYSNGTLIGQSNSSVSTVDDHTSTVNTPDILTGSDPSGNPVRNIAPQAKVIQSSPTQSGYGVENVLPDHPNSSGLVFTGTPPYSFTLGLGYATNVHRIEIFWENNSGIAREYKVDDVDFAGRVFKSIVYQRNISGDRQIIDIPDNQTSSFIKFSFMNMTSLDSPKITHILILADGPDEYQTIVMNSSNYNKIFLSGTDPENPLHIFRVPIRYSMVELADRILAGETNLTDHQKIVKFMQTMDTFKAGIASNANPETIYIEKIGLCGTMSNLLLSLAATQNIKGHMVNMMNYPPNAGHSVSEYYINGKWQLYDSLYGGYYTNTSNDTISPYVLSFEELRNGEGRYNNVIFVTVTPILFKNNGGNSSKFLGYSIYENANPSGPIGPEYPFVFPLKLDLKNESSILIGSNSLLYDQGGNYIGSASMNVNQIWSLNSLVPGKKYCFVITPESIGGDFPGEVFNASAQILDSESTEKSSSIKQTFTNSQLEPWAIEFIAQNSTVQILISHAYEGNYLHYVTIKRYDILDGNGCTST